MARTKPDAPRLRVPLIKPLALEKVKTYPLAKRHSKVALPEFAKPWHPGGSFAKFLDGLPDILAARALREVVDAIAKARLGGKAVAVGMGAHPTKVGLNPVLVDLVERGVITALALTGAVIIHDFELALLGRTSEEVDMEIDTGRFGMAEETGRLINQAIARGVHKGLGIGEALGNWIEEQRLPYRKTSLLAAGARLGIPVTVHVAVGTDIIHMHPAVDGAALGEGSLRDFRLFAAVVAGLEGGVYMNLGSAVIMPEVFIKALTLARNLGHVVDKITTVNVDFLTHYRPLMNVVRRPTQKGGTGHSLIGHHELMLPLLAAGVLERLSNKRSSPESSELRKPQAPRPSPESSEHLTRPPRTRRNASSAQGKPQAPRPSRRAAR